MSTTTSRLSIISNSCDFCLEYRQIRENEFARRYGHALPDRTMLLAKNFRVFPSLGQLAEGHLLITPLDHYTAMADTPLQWIQDLESLLAKVRGTLESVYGQCVFFEHGTRGPQCGGCGIYHAHTHAVPIPMEWSKQTLGQDIDLTEIQSLADIVRYIPDDCSYLYLEDAASRRFVSAVKCLPSQYVRRLVAQKTGKQNWDWRQTGFEEELIAAFNRCSLS